jgi:hypothetical protein
VLLLLLLLGALCWESGDVGRETNGSWGTAGMAHTRWGRGKRCYRVVVGGGAMLVSARLEVRWARMLGKKRT